MLCTEADRVLSVNRVRQLLSYRARNAEGYNLEVTKLIPMGDDTCHFRIWKKEKGEEDLWRARSKALAKREA